MEICETLLASAEREMATDEDEDESRTFAAKALDQV